MMIELWERLRGYDRWIETTALVERAGFIDSKNIDQRGNVSHTYSSSDRIAWTDTNQKKHRANFSVPDSSPLYYMVGGESVTIRYDPTNPDHYYYRELLRSRIATAVRAALLTLLGLGLLALLIWILYSFR